MADYVPFEEGFTGSDFQPVSPVTVYFATDYRESQKMDQFYPEGTNWWEGAAKYGLSRAIDAAFGPPATDKTMTGATYAGQNGRTYANGTGSGKILGMDPLMVLLLGGIAYAAFSD